MRAGFRTPLRLLSLVAPGQAVVPGPLTPAQIARLRGPLARRTETPLPVVAELEQAPAVVEPPPPERREGVSVPSAGPDWAPLAVRAALDLIRRQREREAAEDEAALVLALVLLEEI